MTTGGGAGRWVARIVALLATVALLGVGVAIATMIRADADTGPDERASAATATPTPTKSRKASRPRLTVAQRAARRAAVAELHRQGFLVVRLADWRAHQTLRVLIGAQGSGAPRRAFFFVGRRYLGNDASTPSSGLRIGSQSTRTITLVYPLWRPGDRACCPHGGKAFVRFRWQAGALRPLGAIPDENSRRPSAGG
jgi:LppP/LprE lipoprotein